MTASPQVFIDGEFHLATQAEPVLEAATGEPIGDGASGTGAEVDAAVAAARAALPQWRSASPDHRAGVLLAFAAALHARAETTDKLVTRENGMPMSLSRGANGLFPAALLGYYAKLITETPIEQIRPSAIGHTIVRREPVGVVAAIVPWNYPQALAAFKLAPALAAGCTVVLKAAPETALDALVFAEAAQECGMPPGVLNVVPGGVETGKHLVSHPGVDKVSFTGSTAAGRIIGEVCGRLLRPVTLELGGKSAAIILDDADLEATMRGLRSVSFVNNGQTCYLGSRILAPRSRYAEVVDALADLVNGFSVGDPLDRATDIGPVVSARQRDRVLDYIEAGKSSGAKLVVGGGVPKDQPRGWFVSPTVFANVDNSDRIAQEEIFGPVVALTSFDDEADALKIANDTLYGLGAGVWSRDGNVAYRAGRDIKAGRVWTNCYHMYPAHAAFGGYKQSGIGRENHKMMLDHYQQTKNLLVSYSQNAQGFF